MQPDTTPTLPQWAEISEGPPPLTCFWPWSPRSQFISHHEKVLNLPLIVIYSSNIQLVAPTTVFHPPFSPLRRKRVALWKVAASQYSIYRHVAGVELSDVQVTDSKSVKRLWRNLLSSPGLVETKDHSQKGGELHEYWCDRDVPYTAV